MNSREQEYKAIFKSEALEINDYLSRLIILLEKDPDDTNTLAEIFRLFHNLKANAKAMGYTTIADLSHKLETAFGLVRGKELKFQGMVVNILLNGIDQINDLINHLENEDYHIDTQLLIKDLDCIIEKGISTELELQSVNRTSKNQNLALSDLIYIRIKKLDDILNLVGELIIDKDRIVSLEKQIGNEELRTVVSHLHRITNALQNSVMDARLVEIGSLFNKFPRIIRDVAKIENKNVNYTITGQEIQIDRNILQVITDSLLHIVRNAVAHGIEPKSQREKNGKNVDGMITLSASNDKDTVIITLEDDGGGIDLELIKEHAIRKGLLTMEKAEDLNASEIFSFIFEPGFSLSKNINETSGRGVGLDVVKNAIDSIGGKINIDSKKGLGTKFSLTIPTSMAIKGALLFEVNKSSYAIPLIHTQYVLTVDLADIHQIGSSMILDVKTETLPLIHVKEFFNSSGSNLGTKKTLDHNKLDIIIVSYNNRKLGLIVDKFLRQQDIVIKPLHHPVDQIDLFGGVTLLGNGEICLVMDIPSITKNFITMNLFSVV